jgi:hypothetical protein
MFKMLSVLWAALSSFFGAFEKFGSALNHLGGWAESAAAAIADEARIEREERLAVRMSGLRKTEKAIAADEAKPSSSVPAI